VGSATVGAESETGAGAVGAIAAIAGFCRISELAPAELAAGAAAGAATGAGAGAGSGTNAAAGAAGTGFDSMSAGIGACCDTTGADTPVTVQTSTMTATSRAMTPAMPTTMASRSNRSGDGDRGGA
jgi:hypothetical protein